MKVHHICLLLLTLLVFSCSSPQELYEKGNYKKAYEKVLGDLDKKKTRKNKTLLNKSFAKIIDDAKGELRTVLDDVDIDIVEDNLKVYNDVTKLYRKGKEHLDEDSKLIYEEFNTNGNDLFYIAYNEGNELIRISKKDNSKLAAQEAYEYYNLLEKYADQERFSDYNKLESHIGQAYSLGTIVTNIEIDMGFNYDYDWEVDRQMDDLEGNQNFQRVVFEEYSNQVDCNVELNFSRLDIDTDQRQSSRNFSEEVQDGYTTKVDTNGVTTKIPKYKKVTGTVTTYQIIKRVAWEVDLRVKQVSNDCNLRSDRLRRYVTDEVEEYRISGDERAIPSQYFNTPRQEFRNTDDMVDDLLYDIYQDIRDYIYR